VIDDLIRKARARARDRGGKKLERYRVGDDTVTTAEIAKRLGILQGCARSRIGALRGMPGSVTWERLAAFGKREKVA
jgi:hypothetical protein